MQNNTSQFYSSNAYNNQQVCGAGTTDYYGVASLGSIGLHLIFNLIRTIKYW